jgi:hypothetical protein
MLHHCCRLVRGICKSKLESDISINKKVMADLRISVLGSSGNLWLCYVTTSGQMVLPVTTRNIIFCSHGCLLHCWLCYVTTSGQMVLSSFVRMAFPCYNKKNLSGLQNKKNNSSDPTLICTISASAPPSRKSINRKRNYLHKHVTSFL